MFHLNLKCMIFMLQFLQVMKKVSQVILDLVLQVHKDQKVLEQAKVNLQAQEVVENQVAHQEIAKEVQDMIALTKIQI